ncbi:non-ribosomal peptide synthetase [Nocardia iowensis]|uniref:Amino acid adenylation domain-containing protein n=1 Tax=Nocardia iowensis TaxID=204891 RepID=A0ABX8RJK3_NOCIO|nr:non-ribosomal peptide synthetase [Nocardia iowensis]QXN88475.1 amino acid adenylation domain-containing protein [Nocardia iowensis]
MRTRRSGVTTLPRLLAVAAEADPDGTAVAFGGASLSYRELDELSSRLARFLIGRNIGAGALVAVVIESSIEAVSAMWAVAKTGAGFVVIDANAPARQAERLLSEVKPVFGLTVAASWPGFEPNTLRTLRDSIEWLRIDDPGVRRELAQLSGEPVTYADRLRPIREDDIAYVTAAAAHSVDAVSVTQAELAAIGLRPDRPHLPKPLTDFFATVFTRSTHPGKTLAELFGRAVAAYPDAIAVKFGAETLTYRELDIRANRLARKLIAMGVGPEKLVAVALPRSLDLIIALLATMQAGGAYLPVDPAYPADRIAYLLADAEPVCVVTGPGITLPTAAPSILATGTDLSGMDGSPVGDEDRSAPLRPANLAYVIYTSGSTGRPKGVQIPHHNVVALFANTRPQFGFDHRDVWTMFHSYAFDFSVWELWGALLHGGTLVVVDHDTSRAADQFLELLRTERVTVLSQTPSAFYQLAEADRIASASADVVPLSLRYIVFGGEALEFRRLDDWRARHGDSAAHLVNMYGITETTVHVTCHRVVATERSVIGSALTGLRILVLDNRLRPVPAGVPGEIYIGGAQLARGYLGHAGLTAGRFVANPFAADGSRLYRSGDLAVWNSDGNLGYLGRADDQVKVRGFRIELGEIETALLALESVRQVAVDVREDTPGDQRIVAYIVGRSDVAEVRTELASRLPDYMVPSAVVVMDALPLTAHGKLNRKALPAPIVETAVFRAPEHPIEKTVADVFAAVLGVDRTGLDDNFFALGGNSLLATQVAARLGAELDARVPARLLFTAPTVVALAAEVGRHLGATGRRALVAEPRPERIPLSMAQQRMWFLNQFDRDSAAYNIPVAVRLTGVLNVAALRQAIWDVIARHETLRTFYPQHNGVPYQSILPAEQAVIDLTPEPVDAAAVLPRIAEVATTGFDVAFEVPLRASLFHVYTGVVTEHVLVFVAHHICSDGWSMGPLTRDVMVAYAARSVGAEPDWVPLVVQYADFSRWQREVLGSETDPDSLISRQVDYWRTTLSGLPDELALPFDRPRPATRSLEGGQVLFSIDGEVYRGLCELARARNATLFMVLHTAFAVFLARWSGTDDIVVGTAVAGRGEPELDAVIGMFVNTLVLRTKVRGQENFGELLERVRDVDLDAFAHADIPFERLVELLNPDRSTARNPLFQVGLVFQNLPEATFELPGLHVAAVDFETRVEKFDLSLVIRETGAGLAAQVSFARDVFDEATIRAMTDRFTRLLAEIVARPQSPVGDLPLLAEDEYAALTEVRPVEATAGALMPELLLRGVRWGRDRVAVRDHGRTITYGELDDHSAQLARVLIDRGVGPETLVALSFPRSYEMLSAVLAVARAGGAYVPVDPTYPVDRVRHMVTDSAAVIGLTTAEYVAHLPGELTWLVVDHPAMAALCAQRSALPITDADRIAPLRPHNPAYLIYTSGSTGVPKGVTVTHAGLAGLIEHAVGVLNLEPQHRLLHSISPSFDPAALEWLCALSVGATLIIVPPTVIGGPELAAVLRDERVTHGSVTPAVLSTIDPTGVPIGTWLVGGDITTPELVAKWQPGRRYINAYGPTEATIAATFGAQTAGRDITIGTPVPGVSAVVLDSRLNPVPPGVTGELYLAGAALARGYHERAGLTADRFLANPWGEPGARMFRTGDMVRRCVPPEQSADAVSQPRWDLKYVGRSDFQVKVRGFRIELGEIDAVLGGHEDVDFAVTVGRETASRETVLVSYVRGVPGRQLDADRLTGFAARRLPRHMVPAAIVVLDELPLTPVGKLDRKALPDPRFEAAAFRPPSTPTEEAIAEVFAQVLGVEQVGADDDFFARGGTSLLTLTLQHALSTRLGVDLPVSTLFSAATVRGLAARIAGQDAPVHDPAVIAADAVLGPEISTAGRAPSRQGPARDVLLTGATGFVGAYLLRELLDRTDALVWCLVRADNGRQGRDRIHRALRRYQLWDDALEARIVAVPGDLAAPSFGLSAVAHAWLADRIDAIYHNGAKVNHLEPYSRLRAANVGGTREVLRLATTRRIKPVHFVSTANTVIATVRPGAVVRETTRITADELPAQGYVASKWAAEQLVRHAGERGVPVRIYRPGLVSGDLRLGINSADDSFWNMIRAAVILGVAPEVGAATISLVPVNYVARAIVEISIGPAAGIEYHLVNDEPVAIRDIFDCLRKHGLAIETESLDKVQQRLADEAHTRYLAGDDSLVRAALLGSNYTGGAADVVLDSTNTRRALAESAISCPPIDENVLDTYIGAFMESGFLPTPIGTSRE